jgi:hypothetical protein
MKNVQTEVKGKKLIITVDLDKEFGPSASGKTIIIGTTGGNKEVTDGVFAGLNVYRYATAKG